jgi:protein SCO1/2
MSPRQRLIAALLGLATLVVIAFAQRGLPWPDQRPIPWVAPTPTSLADLELDDGAGHAVGAEILAGHWTVVAVGYTSCPDVCPTALARLADAVSREPTLAAAFLAVDPARDRAHLAAYVAAFHPAIRGLTGTPAQLDRAVAALGATYVDNRDGTFDHSAAVFVVDPQGNLAGALPAPRDGAEVVAGVSALRDTWRPALEIELWTPRQLGPVGVGYGRFKNRGERAIAVTGVAPLGVAGRGRIEVHASEVVDGVARMRQLETLTIAPGGTAVLAPGGQHLMLVDGAAAAPAVVVTTDIGAIAVVPLIPAGRGDG